MVLAAPAMVAPAPAPVAAVEAEARAGHAATPHVAAKGLHVTLLAIPAPARAPAPRFTSAKAMVCLRAEVEIFTSHNKSGSCVTCSHCLFVFPFFGCGFLFSFHFYSRDEPSLPPPIFHLFSFHKHLFFCYLFPYSILSFY